MAKKSGDKGLELILLGIIAILAIVGLVLLFTKAGVTGNASLGSVSAATGGQQRGLQPWDHGAPRMKGELPMAAQWGSEVSGLEASSEKNERRLDYYPPQKREEPLEKRFEGGQFEAD